jgi:hypothetical protein
MAGSSMPMQDDHPDSQATPDLSTPTKDGQPYKEATPDPSDATPTPRECHSAPRTVYRGGAAQAKVALNRHFTRAEDNNQKTLAN